MKAKRYKPLPARRVYIPKNEHEKRQLDLPAPRIRAYPPEAVVAEKFESMVSLGMLNSRMKDYYDLRMMAREFKFDGNTLTKAIKATFTRRNTDIPHEIPIALTEEFSSSPDKVTQWQAFLRRSKLGGFLSRQSFVIAVDIVFSLA